MLHEKNEKNKKCKVGPFIKNIIGSIWTIWIHDRLRIPKGESNTADETAFLSIFQLILVLKKFEPYLKELNIKKHLVVEAGRGNNNLL